MRFRPSQASYWSRCAAFVRFTQNMPETTNDAAREGTCAAWVAELVLTGEMQTCREALDCVHENGWVVDLEMIDLVQEYVDTVRSYGGTVGAEEFIRASENPLIEGTLDSSVSALQDGILRIIDLKYGRRIVETTTPQLICYGYGKMMKEPAGSVREIHLSIYQPRAIHRDGIYRTRVVTPEELHAEFVGLWEMAVEGMKPDSMATPGPHCADCEAAASCEALAHTSYNLVHQMQSRIKRDMTAEELSKELKFIRDAKATVNARINAVTAEAEARLKKESIPGWKLERKKGKRAFTQSGVNIQLLTGIDPWERKLCTPAELERRGATEDQLKGLVKTPETGLKLAEVKSNDIAEIFKD